MSEQEGVGRILGGCTHSKKEKNIYLIFTLSNYYKKIFFAMYTVEKKYLRSQAKGLELKFYYFLPLFSIVLNNYNRSFAGRRGKGEGGEREWGARVA